ncbi:LacI family transcriptional regulator [Oceanomicrobium pacificus]|uniref:Substrate-binding domain-containing protein n=1 Tax=Oceanomicrobium pacificus TaxID=2692916 RepID=A0A6B0TN29_9RHOB|nr:LacI family transcriptional regulator [Oceanomicrobium pacificus]MXU66000.1 substrate-binding domain-containing protein [Oceanomicrobium pacificus]
MATIEGKSAGEAGRSGDERPTLKTIAYMTGLGVTTVSRALRDAPDIGQATKERVRLVADQIGYRPNRAGVRLRTGKTNVISLTLSIEEEVMGLTPSLVFGLSERLTDTPYHLVVTPYSLSNDPLDPVRYVVETGGADGIILSRTQPDDPRVRYLIDRKFPFVTHGRTDMGFEHDYFDFDNDEFGYRAAQHLIAKGRNHLALLPPPMTLTYGHHMTAGFSRAVAEADVLDIPIRTITVDDPMSVIEAEITRMMAGRHRPDGLVCGSGAATIAATAGIEAAGLTIGKDIDLVGKQSIDILGRFRPAISRFNEDVREAGRQLADALVARIADPDAPPRQNLMAASYEPEV